MKKQVFLFLLFCTVLFTKTQAQSTLIQPGTILPKMTTAQRTAVVSPVDGMLVFDTNTLTYWYRKAGLWSEITSGAGTGTNFWQQTGLGGNEIKNTNSGGFWSVNPVGLVSGATDITNPPTVPISGAGTRLMWIPNRSAFRVGTVSSDNPTVWDAVNIGLFSFASGFKTKASGNSSTAMGLSTTANGSFSTALGFGTNANNFCSIAMGNYTNATGLNSTAMGVSSTASGEISTALGDNTLASGDNSTSLGKSTIASAANSTAMGYLTKATGISSTSTGISTTASGFYSTAMGNSTFAIGDNSTALGNGTTARAENSTALGSFNIDNPNGLFMVGNGSSAINKTIFMVRKDNEKIGIGTDDPEEKLTIKTAYSQYGLLHTEGTITLGTYIGIGRGLFGTKSNHDLGFFTNNGSNQMLLTTEGRVGIGTSAPLAPLHVAGQSTIIGSLSGRYFNFNSILTAYTGNEFSSILADAAITTKTTFSAFQAVTSSDSRIKNIIGISNSAQDLEKLKKIEITDYKMKDVATWGTRSFKKVIAQQVESVYPEIIQKQTQVIPDIYTLAQSVTYNAESKELTITMAKNHELKIGDKLELVHPEKGKLQAIIASTNGNSFTIKNWEHATDKIFVFGHEVSDFRTVDYEALSMLGISAIQQLAKENEELKRGLTENTKLLNDQSKRMERLEALIIK